MKILINTILSLLLVIATVYMIACSTNKWYKEQLLQSYREAHGNNWETWSPETIEQFKTDIKQFN